MTFRNLLVLPALVSIASAASGSTLLARMEQDTYVGYSVPPLYSSANFAFAVFAPNEPNYNPWPIGPLSAADVGRTISLTRDSADEIPSFDWALLVNRLTNSQGDIVWLGLGRPTEHVTGFSGLEQQQIFNGFYATTTVGEAFVPSLTGYDFGGYRFDRFDFLLHSLGFRHEAGYYWIDAHFEVQMFGGLVPEPAAGSLIVTGALLAFTPLARWRR
jgi:hypothetical protein